MNNQNHKRYFARFTVETLTPMGIGSGFEGATVDRLIVKDANGLPYIPGTGLAGVLRHALVANKQNKDQLFGFQGEALDEQGNKEGQGSRLFFSPGILIAPDGQQVLEGLQKIDFDHEYYTGFKRLPERDHVRISDKGVAVKHGKFEEELVYKGARFAFELELEGTSADETIWKHILETLNHPTFRVGAGTRKGFGHLKVLSCKEKIFDLEKKDELLAYLSKPSSLNSSIEGWGDYIALEADMNKWYEYRISLEPENFFLFGAGHGDGDLNMVPKAEKCFDWESGEAKLSEEQVLIPATSVKGAIAHRVAFHYNDLTGTTIESSGSMMANQTPAFSMEQALEAYELGDMSQQSLSSISKEWSILKDQVRQMNIDTSDVWHDYEEKLQLSIQKDYSPPSTGENNPAVRSLFGYAKEETLQDKESVGLRGRVIFSDLFLPKKSENAKILDHVAIDRYTGGTIDGALFQERVVTSGVLELHILVEKAAYEEENIRVAFEQSLKDLCNGQLQLGGNTTKGHGAFLGKPFIKLKDGSYEEI